MSVADQSVPVTNLAGRVPFTVRFSPQFVNRMCDRLRRSSPTQAPVAGLLFGQIEGDLSEVQVFRSVPDAEISNLISGTPAQLNEVIDRLITSSHNDPEVSALTLLGWYSFRATGGLHENDVAFHNRFFRQPYELALILRPEIHPNVLLEIYSKSGATLLSEDEHRWGSLRLATDTTVVGPIDIAMRAKLGDDFYLRAYQVSKSLDRAERREHWMDAVDATKNTLRSMFGAKRKPHTGAEASIPSPPLSAASSAAATPPAATPPQAQARAAVAGAAAYPGITGRTVTSAAPALEPSFNRRAREQSPVRAQDLAGVQKIVAGDPPTVPAVIKQPKRGIPWISSVIVFAVAAGATFALYVQGFATNGDTPRFLRAIFPDTGLSLRVEGEGDRVLLSWNRRNALVRSSNGGVLHIDDGPQHRDVRLDPAQIANGSVLYRPGSDDVSFRLEIHGAEGAAIAETTRVLDGAKAPPLEVKNVTPDLSPTQTATPGGVAPPPTPTAQPRDGRARREEAANPATKRPNFPASTPQLQPNEEHPVPSDFHPTPTTRDTAPSAAPAAPPPVTLSPSTADSSGTGSLTASKPVQTASPTLPSPAAADTHPSSPAASTGSETARLSFPPPTPDTTRQPDTSKVSGWDDATAPVKQDATLPRSAQAPTPEASPAKPTFDAKLNPPTFVPPKPVKQVLPDLRSLTPGAIATAAQLEVAVRVNKKGRVTEAYLVGDASKVAPHLVRAALNAAKQWTFQPATVRGKTVPSDHTIVFEFRPTSH